MISGYRYFKNKYECYKYYVSFNYKVYYSNVLGLGQISKYSLCTILVSAKILKNDDKGMVLEPFLLAQRLVSE